MLWKDYLFPCSHACPSAFAKQFPQKRWSATNKSLLRIKIEFRLPVDKLIDLGALMTESSPKHILIYHVQDCFRINSSIAQMRLYWGPVRAHSLPWNTANFFDRIISTVKSFYVCFSLKLCVEVIIFNILLVNAVPLGVCPFSQEVNFLSLLFFKNLCLRVRLYFRVLSRSLTSPWVLSGLAVEP